VDLRGRNEPSPGYSLHLDGQPYGGDQVVSEAIDLSSYAQAVLLYQYQRAGNDNSPEAGDDLIIEYNAGSGWCELGRQLGDGPDMDTYEKAMVELPEDALNRAFRFRIRNIGLASETDAYDSWFVDDIVVKGVDADAPSLDLNLVALYGDHKIILNNVTSMRTLRGHISLALDADFRMRLMGEARTLTDAGGTWSVWTEPEIIGPGTGIPVELWIEGSGLDIDAMGSRAGDVVIANVELGGVPTD
jgi:hypothetical protein